MQQTSRGARQRQRAGKASKQGSAAAVAAHSFIAQSFLVRTHECKTTTARSAQHSSRFTRHGGAERDSSRLERTAVCSTRRDASPRIPPSSCRCTRVRAERASERSAWSLQDDASSERAAGSVQRPPPVVCASQLLRLPHSSHSRLPSSSTRLLTSHSRPLSAVWTAARCESDDKLLNCHCSLLPRRLFSCLFRIASARLDRTL